MDDISWIIKQIEEDLPEWEWLVRKNKGGPEGGEYFANMLRNPGNFNSARFPTYAASPTEALRLAFTNALIHEGKSL